MIVGVGIDSVLVDRVSKRIQKDEFRKKVFSATEIAYCEKNAHPGEHFAARFAAKEAFLKALGTGLGVSYELNQIEIIHDENGIPRLRLGGQFAALENRWNRIHLSLTHTSTHASAIVILEK